MKICSIDPELNDRLNKFRFRKDKTDGAIVMKINFETQTILEDKSFDPDELSVSILRIILLERMDQTQYCLPHLLN